VSPSSEKDSWPWAWRRALAASGPNLAPPSASMEEREGRGGASLADGGADLGRATGGVVQPWESSLWAHLVSLLLAGAAIPALEPPSCLPVCALFPTRALLPPPLPHMLAFCGRGGRRCHRRHSGSASRRGHSRLLWRSSPSYIAYVRSINH
jgi:hypothetical protein